jgi:hypothetical protein
MTMAGAWRDLHAPASNFSAAGSYLSGGDTHMNMNRKCFEAGPVRVVPP